jgi:hypothetical protein
MIWHIFMLGFLFFYGTMFGFSVNRFDPTTFSINKFESIRYYITIIALLLTGAKT